MLSRLRTGVFYLPLFLLLAIGLGQLRPLQQPRRPAGSEDLSVQGLAGGGLVSSLATTLASLAGERPAPPAQRKILAFIHVINNDRMATIARAWATETPGFVLYFFSKELKDPHFSCVNDERILLDFLFVVYCLKKALRQHPDVGWVFKVDDDAWADLGAVRALTTELEQARTNATLVEDKLIHSRWTLWNGDRLAGDAMYTGYPFRLNGLLYASGGAGYLLSVEAARLLGRCTIVPYPQYEDASVGQCMVTHGVPLLDTHGFFPHNPDQMMLWAINDNIYSTLSYHVRLERTDFFSSPRLTWHYMDVNWLRYLTGAQRVPKILHQLWLHGPLPANIRVLMEHCASLNPGWKHHVWTMDNLPSFSSYVGVPPKYRTITTHSDTTVDPLIKSFILRYELLYQHGGVFLDADSVCVRGLDAVVEAHSHTGRGCFAALDPETGLSSNIAIGCAKKSPAIHAVVHGLAHKAGAGAAWFQNTLLNEQLFSFGAKRAYSFLPLPAFFPTVAFQDMSDRALEEHPCAVVFRADLSHVRATYMRAWFRHFKPKLQGDPRCSEKLRLI